MLALIVAQDHGGVDRAVGEARLAVSVAAKRRVVATRPSGNSPVAPILTAAVTADRHTDLDGWSALGRPVERNHQAEAAARAAAAHQADVSRRSAQERQAIVAGQAWYREAAAHQLAALRVMASNAATRPVPPPAPAPLGRIGGGLVAVRGIVVDAAIAGRLQALLASGDAAGIVLAGAGYRDPAAQRRLRELHCPDPVNSPASACSPATAKPGQSMHEQGLAIDFTIGGTIIGSRSSPAFRWLAANAARFGFSNLPSEPWHWSINGR